MTNHGVGTDTGLKIKVSFMPVDQWFDTIEDALVAANKFLKHLYADEEDRVFSREYYKDDAYISDKRWVEGDGEI